MFDGKDITALPSYERVKLGISQSPEGRGCFAGHDRRARTWRWAPTSARTARPRLRATTCERVFQLFPRLQERVSQTAGTMSGGEQQMLAIGRALMAKPAADPARRAVDGAGAQADPADLLRSSREINAQGTTVLLVEQNAAQALKRGRHGRTSSRPGRSSASGTGAELSGDDSVKAAYLGGDV